MKDKKSSVIARVAYDPAGCISSSNCWAIIE